MWFAIDTLEYLRRGGRIGGARAWIGSALKIKPILTLEEEITPIERVRTRARSLERLRDYARQRHADGADGWVVQHIQDEETAAALADDCREIYGCEPAFISEIGAVLGAHVGPGLLGVGGVPAKLICASEEPREAGVAACGGRTSGATPTTKPTAAAAMISSRLCSLDLAAPVGQLGDAAAQLFDRAAELLALEVDVAADLLRRAAGPAGRRGPRRLGFGSALTSSPPPWPASPWSASPPRSPARAPAASRP